MRPKSKRFKHSKLILLLILIGIGFGVYLQTRPVKEATSPLTIQPATPATRDAARKKSLTSLAEAISNSYKLHGKYPFTNPKVETGICNASSLHCKQVKLIDINQVISDGFLAAIPNDPIGGRGQYNSGFSIRHDIDGSTYLLAPRTENGSILSVKL
ncbi:MAG: hypothetical protein ABIS59_01590 [Candidatus Saccharibacteria bacterium]